MQCLRKVIRDKVGESYVTDGTLAKLAKMTARMDGGQ